LSVATTLPPSGDAIMRVCRVGAASNGDQHDRSHRNRPTTVAR
jgi:hypothetical protein